MDWAQQSDDLTSYALNEDIKSVLKQRFSLQRPVTMIGAQSMLVLESVPTTIEQREEYHSQALQQSKGEATWLAPHSIQIVSNAFIEMLKTQQPQTISTWGNSGSGKSTTHEMLRTQLIEISPTKKKSKVLSGASKMESVLDAFGVYQSQTGPTSGYGRVTEYQYSKQGRMIGIKLLDYGLEKIRVSQVPGPECEKTYNIFYLVLCASELEKSEWELTDVTNFSYTKGVAQKQNTLSRKLTLSRSKSISRKPDPSQQENLSNTFELLKQNLKSLGIGKGLQKSLFKTIAAILHLGNLQFYDDDGKCLIKNQETLLICAKQLQVSPQELENTIIYKSKQIGKDTFSSMLTAKEAALNRDELTQCLYGLCFTYLIGHLNDRLCKDDHEVDCLLRLCDFPFIRQGSKLEIFVGNYMVEKMYNNMHSYQFDDYQLLLKQQGFVANEIKYLDNQVTVDLFDGTQRVPGLWKWLGADSNLDKLDEMLKPNPHYLQNSQCGVYSLKETKVYLFGVKHYINGPSIEYDLESFYQQDSSISDFVALFKKEEESFVGNLFSKTNGIIKVNGGESLMQTPMRKPSIKGNPVEKKEFKGIQSAVDNLLSSILKSKKWDIYCVNPLNDLKGYDDSKVEGQLVNLNIRELVQIKTLVDVDVDNAIGYDQFMTKYGSLVATFGASRGAGSTSIDAVNAFIAKQFWPKRHVFCGTQKLFLNQSRWRFLDHNLEKLDQENLQMHPELSPVVDQDWDKVRDSYYKDDEYSDGESQPESDYQYEQPKKDIETGDSKKNEHIQVTEDLTCTRKCWICCTWSLTWCIPGPFLNWCGGMKRGDIRMAWREKVALCIIIATLCGALLFFIVGLRFVICPPQKVLTHDEVRELRFPRFAKAPLQAHFAAYGQYYDATALMDSHKKSYGSVTGSQGIPDYIFEQFYGSDVSYLFNKVNAWEYYCPGIPRPLIPDYDNLDGNLAWQKRTNNIQGDIPGSNKYANVHSNKSPTGTPQLYASAMYKYSTGLLGWTVKSIETLSSTEKVYIILFNNVYYTPKMLIAKDSFNNQILDLFGPTHQGEDITKLYVKARLGNPKLFDDSLKCINEMYYIGTVDTRDTVQCQVTNLLLFGASIVLVAVIGIKFLAALQFGTKKEPELADKFVILMVPCYTEGVDGLTKTLDSLATFQYDDKRKLLLVICDGMIIGSGNDRPTPRIVLDILGVDASQDPEPLAFQSLGEGNKQYNMGKVYSGLYEIRGHAVPFVVIVKCGSQKERVKPGNRGKRDSQLIMMRFLNRVHFNSAFAPLELEIYHQMKNIIGVSPAFYEFILMVDADTEVEPTSLNRMISVMINDSKIMGLCGETSISNEKESWVYEYFISHHLAKAFESLFGTVTCLPGCFSMYRIRAANKNIPVLVSPGILEDYSENNVDTLHKKNLLHLGEDRYLTTLLLKHFPTYRTKFTGEARCSTVAPDRWAVLLSQRRRWINSTVHNLFELGLLDQLCGFCCFSMRFVVLLDLFATFVQPATILYIGYLIFAVSSSREVFPVLSLILIAAIYGFQIIIFILKREWQHIAWMFIYLAATPVIALYIPLYSFWHFDDFSWGNTRVVVGEGKKIVYVADSEPFDPKSIPLKRWKDFEDNDLWEEETTVTKSTRKPTSEYAYSEYSGSQRPSAFDRQTDPRQSVMSGQMDVRQSVTGKYDMRHSVNAQVDPRQSVISGGLIPGPFVNQMAQITDEMLYNEIRQALVGADLMTLTKKQIRDNLSAKLGVDLKPRKETMNRMIDDILSRQ